MNRNSRSGSVSVEAVRGWPRTAATAIVVLGFMLAVTGLMGCGSSSDYENVVAQRDAANRSNVSLTSENAILKARIPTLIYGSYEDLERGVELSYPAAWARRDTQQILPFYESPDGTVNVGVTSEDLPEPMTTYAYFVVLNERLEAAGYLLSGVRPIDVGNASGLQAVYLHNGLIQVFVVVVQDQTAWSLIQTAKADQFLDWAHSFNEIVASFNVD